MPTAFRREVVQVPEGSEDAKKWPVWSESGASNQNTTSATSNLPTPAALVDPKLVPKPKPRGPRKSKLVLPSLPTPSQHKAEKLTTLDKSSMDWKAHISSDSAATKDELETNRRSGGYLGRVEFLQRVSERKDYILEETQAKKRRR